MHHLLRMRIRLLALLAVLLTAALSHATPTRAVTVSNCGGSTCVTLTATMADGKALENRVDPAKEADEPDEDEVVHLVANASGPLPPTWQLQIVDVNNNLYANCGAATQCEVFVWNDEDGQLFFQQNFVPDQKASPATPPNVPYGPDGHTVQFAGRVVDAGNNVVTQASYGVVFEEGPGKD